MPTLTEASLTESERRALDRLVTELGASFGARLKSVWLYGSRARAEKPRPESDIDVLVVVEPMLDNDDLRAIQARRQAPAGEGHSVPLSVHVMSSERLANRRAIESFFIREVDRDKIVLLGDE